MGCYDIETRRIAIELFFKKNRTRKQIADELDASLSSVKRWIRVYRDFGDEGLKDHRGTWRDGIPRMPRSIDKGLDEGMGIGRRCHQLELENAYLKRLWVLTGDGSARNSKRGSSNR